jgi:hypothetical protein
MLLSLAPSHLPVLFDHHFSRLLGMNGPLGTKSLAQGPGSTSSHSVQVVASYHNDVSPPLREIPAWNESDLRRGTDREANENPKVQYRPILRGVTVDLIFGGRGRCE